MKMTLTKEKEVLLEILKNLKEMPFIWNKSNEQYYNKQKRNEGFCALLEMYQQFDENATVKTLKKRLDNMRTNYYKELGKVRKSIQAGGELYVPSLWYFESYRFLEANRDPYPPVRDSVDLTSTEEEQEEEQEEETSHSEGSHISKSESYISKPESHISKSEIHISKPESHFSKFESHNSKSESHFSKFESHNSMSESRISKPPRKKIKYVQQTAEISMVNREVDAEIMGRAIGVQLRDLRSEQLTIARKLISDVIYYASLDKLTPDSKVALADSYDSFHDNSSAIYFEHGPSSTCDPIRFQDKHSP